MEYKSEKQKEALQKQGKYLQQYNQKNKILSEKDVRLVRKLYIDGLSSIEIAEIYGCSKPVILKVIKDIPKRPIGSSPNHRSKHQSGENNTSWKGGIKSVYDRFRDLNEYWHWRKAVLNRDNNCCTECGSKNNLHSHHIKYLKQLISEYCNKVTKLPKDLIYEELTDPYFYDISNGRTLCEPCHKYWHKIHGR